MPEIELAWCAGIVDGEGCIGVYGSSGARQLQLNVGNTSLAMVRRLEEVLGGTVYTPYADTADRIKPMYKYRVIGKKAVEALISLMPYLVVKKDQALEAVTFFELDSIGREALYVRLRDMKKVS